MSIERDPVLFALLENGIARLCAAGVSYAWTTWLGDANTYLRAGYAPPDVIYMDPMFPTRTKKASVKKEMQFVRRLVTTPQANEEQLLLQAALSVARKRVVVKRPIGAPCIGNIKPTGFYARGGYRWDIYCS